MTILKDDIGARLWASLNDVTLVGLALHPVFKGIAEPPNFPCSVFQERNGKTIACFFCRGLQERMKAAILRELQRMDIKRDAVGEPVQQEGEADDFYCLLVKGYRRARQNDILPTAEIEAWFSAPVVRGVSAAAYWAEHGNAWPLLKKLARANFVAQASSAASERIWSLADDLCGGDRTDMDPKLLNTMLILKKNTPVQAQMMGCGLLEVFEGGE